MQPTPWNIAICLILFCSIALADDFKTIYGKEYKNAKVSRVEPDGIVLTTNSGISKVYFVELPKGIQDRFHYDAAQAAQFTGATQANTQTFNAQVAQTEQKRKQALEQQRLAAEQERQSQMRQEQIAAQQQQRQLVAQQKQQAKIAAHKQAREKQHQKARRTTSGPGDHWQSWKHTFPGGYEEMSGDARMGHYHSESHSPRSPTAASTDNVTDSSWGPAP